MIDISRLLQMARSGSASDRQFLGIIHREVRRGAIDAAALLAALHDEKQAGDLPPGLRRETMAKLQTWIAAPTEAPEPGPWGYETTDTVVNPEALRSVLAASAPSTASAANADAAVWRPEAGTARVGRILKERFQLIERIGSGGMSTVFKAVDRRLTEAQSPDPYVAVKTLNLPAGDHAAALALLQREAQKLQTLAHPNIVRVMDCDRDGPLVFMTMEYLNGESLKHRLQSRSQGLAAEEAARTLAGMGAALTYAHRHHIVHGDLKPANVILTGAGQVKVIDFGVARIVSQSQHSEGAALPAEANIAMTPAYASPEMLAGAAPDARDDVYALGCMASELFSGTHPYEQRSAVQAQAEGLKAIHGAGLSQRQFRAIRHAVQFEREQRTSSVERFLIEFGLDLSAVEGTELPTSGSRTSPQTIGAIVIGLLLLLGVSLWWFRHPSARTTAPATAGSTSAAASAAPAVNSQFSDCATCPLMKVLPPGQFQQGSASGAQDAVAIEYPQHAVTIAYAFAIGVHDVTVAQFAEYAEATGSEPSGCWAYDGKWSEHDDLNWRQVGFKQGPSHPATCISWREAAAYAEWLSSRTGQRYRLPSASEWEYAARAGAADARPWGTQPTLACQSANVADASAMSQFPGWKTFGCRDGYVYTSPVGSFAPNAFGLYDTLGNVFQWVADCWHDSYDGAPHDGSAWRTGDCSRHEVRGGSWFTDPAFVRTTYRSRFGVDYRTNTVGFRLVRVIK